MRIFRFSDSISKKIEHPTVVSIGNFDGIHKGHQYIFNYLIKLSKISASYATIICFEPHPKEFFSLKKAPLRINTFREKMLTLKSYGIDQVLCIRFTQKFANLSGENFIQKILVDNLHIKHIVIGKDFRFGHNRESGYLLLKKFGKKFGFSIHNMDDYCHKNNRISSSQIRELLRYNKFRQVSKLLNRSYCLSGRVHYGNKKGRKLGFPTINIPVIDNIILSGVYIINICWKNKDYYGIANVGIRPTFSGKKKILEVHIFNFNQDIYEQYVKIIFLTFIRPEKKFYKLYDLVEQIKKDKFNAYHWIKKYSIK